MAESTGKHRGIAVGRIAPEDEHEDYDSQQVEGGEQDGKHVALHYQPWLTVTGERLAAIGEEVFAAIPAPAVTPGRSPRKDATERRKLCVMNLLANLAVLALSPLEHDALVLSVMREKQTRYNRAGFTRLVLQNGLEALAVLGIITLEVGKGHRQRTRALLSAGFTVKLHAHGVTLADVGPTGSGETILLRTRGERGQIGELLDYRDDALTNSMRQDMEALNVGLNEADIRLDGRRLGPILMVRIFQELEGSARWTRHGRIYRAVHLDMPKEQRYRLTMGGESLCDLDWRACFIGIAYAWAGQKVPSGDPYAIPGLERHRDTVKRVFNALFSQRPARDRQNGKPFTLRLPKGARRELPEGWTGKRFLEAAVRLHPALAPTFGKSDVVFELMKTESDMMMEVLRELRAVGCIAAPCHDGLLCQRRHQSLAIEKMRQVSKRMLGRELEVVEKPLPSPFRPK